MSMTLILVDFITDLAEGRDIKKETLLEYKKEELKDTIPVLSTKSILNIIEMSIPGIFRMNPEGIESSIKRALDKINEIVYPIEVDFYLKYFMASLKIKFEKLDHKASADLYGKIYERYPIIENPYYQKEFLRKYLREYLDSEQYDVQKIRDLSQQLKVAGAELDRLMNAIDLGKK